MSLKAQKFKGLVKETIGDYLIINVQERIFKINSYTSEIDGPLNDYNYGDKVVIKSSECRGVTVKKRK